MLSHFLRAWVNSRKKFNVLREDGAGETPQAQSAEEKEKRKRLVQPRQALEGLALKSLFDFIVRTEVTRGARRCS
jgi:hypothetical protein